MTRFHQQCRRARELAIRLDATQCRDEANRLRSALTHCLPGVETQMALLSTVARCVSRRVLDRADEKLALDLIEDLRQALRCPVGP